MKQDVKQVARVCKINRIEGKKKGHNTCYT